MNRTSFLVAIAFAFCGVQTSHAASKPVPVPTVPDTVRLESDVAYLPADRKERADL